MTEEQWEEAMENIVDNATHAAFQHIPKAAIDRRDGTARMEIMVAINDALRGVLGEVIEPDDLPRPERQFTGPGMLEQSGYIETDDDLSPEELEMQRKGSW